MPTPSPGWICADLNPRCFNLCGRGIFLFTFQSAQSPRARCCCSLCRAGSRPASSQSFWPPAREDGNSKVALSTPCRDTSRHPYLCRGRSLLFTFWTVFVTSCLFANMFGPMLEVSHKPYTSSTKASHVGGSQRHASRETLEASQAKSHPTKT